MPKPPDARKVTGVPPIHMTLRQVANQKRIPPAVQAMTNIETTVDIATQELVLSVVTWMAEHHYSSEWAEREVLFAHNWDQWDSWWQHTKAVHFPTLSRWLRRPPRPTRHVYREERLVRLRHSVFAGFPDADFYPVPLGTPIIIERWDEDPEEQTIHKTERMY